MTGDCDDRDGGRVVIVGAGLCGLVAAFELHQRGIPAVVLEASERAGGRVRTIRFADGAVAEAGMEEFWETSPAYEMLRELGIPFTAESAWSSVILGGRLSVYDDARGSESYFERLFPGSDADHFERWNEEAWRILDQYRSCGWGARHRSEWMVAEGPHFAAFVGALDLPNRLRSWIRVHVETESAIEWNRISVLDGLHEMLPFLIPRSGSHTPRAVRVEGGNVGFIEALLARLPPDSVRLGTRVVSVSADTRGADVACVAPDGRGIVVRGHHALLTAPIWSLRSMVIAPPLRDCSRIALESARFGSYVKVILRLRPDSLGIWEHDGEHPFTLLTDGPTGCIYLTDGRPDGRDHVLTMLVHGRSARSINGRSYGHIVRRAISNLEHLNPSNEFCPGRGTPTPLLHGLRESITSATVVDHPQAVAYWPHELGRSRFDALAESLRTPHGRILIGGDTTETSHSDGAVRAGLRMARVVADRIDCRETVAT